MKARKPKTAVTDIFIIGNEKLIISAVFVTALILRLYYIFELRNRFPMFTNWILDERDLHNWAVQISKGTFGSDVFHYPPLYPSLLAILYSIFGQGYLVPRLCNVVTGCLTCIVIYILGKKLFNERIGLLASVIAVFYKPFFFYEGQALSVSMSVFFVSVTLLLLIISMEEGEKKYWVFSGIAMGLCIFTRANFMLLPPFIALWILFIFWEKSKKIIISSVIAFLLGVIITVLPATVRNYTAAGDFVISSTTAGQNFFIGNNIYADAIPVSLTPEMSSIQQMKRFFIRKAVEFSSQKDIQASDISKIWFKIGVNFIKDNPLKAMKLFIKKFFLFYNHYEVPGNSNIYFMEQFSSLLKFPLFMFSIIGPLGIIGLFLSFKERRCTLFYVWLGIYTLSVVIFHVTSRFRMPIVPIIILFASSAVFRFYEQVRDRQWQKTILLLSMFLSLYFAVNIDLVKIDMDTAYANMGMHYMGVGKFEKAIGILKKILKKNPDNSVIHYKLSLVYREQKKYDLVLNELNLALEGLPDYARLYIEMGEVYLLMRRYEEALSAFNKAYQMEPMFADAVNEIGRVYMATGKLDMAEKKFKKAIIIEPEFPMAYNNLGILYFRQGKMDKAIRQISKALQYSPVIFGWDNLSAMYNLGLAYMKTGQTQKAIDQFIEIVDNDTDNINSLFLLGTLYSQMGKRDKAIFYFKRTLEIAPDYLKAKIELEKIR